MKFGVNNIADNRSVTGISGDPTGQLSVNNTKLTYSYLAGRLFYGGLKVEFLSLFKGIRPAARAAGRFVIKASQTGAMRGPERRGPCM